MQYIFYNTSIYKGKKYKNYLSSVSTSPFGNICQCVFNQSDAKTFDSITEARRFKRLYLPAKWEMEKISETVN